ncbi:MAG: MBL fold metallo-hydrolase [Alphaproteobacteria bacterium]|nr:MBL fold metallo-hydrolase [Alphaproteobacteria bacterium]
MGMRVRFWGVRGSIACSSSEHVRYGGNTSCIEIRADGRRIVFDAGTGIRTFGQQLLRDGDKDIRLLLTHTHWDHINGFPFFAPAYNPAVSVHVMAGHLRKVDSNIRDVLSAQMHSPMFPVPLEAMRAKISFEDFSAGDDLSLFPDVKIRTRPLNHPNGATGYRVEHAGRTVAYVTDTEHVPGRDDANVLALIEGADLAIYDSTYTEEEFPNRIGWGHSTWNEGVRLCRMAGAKKLAIFHHDPDHDDAFMDRIAAEAAKAWPGALVSREGMEIEI